MIRTIAAGIVATTILLVTSAWAQDEHDCEVARYYAAGKYAVCEAKNIGNGFDNDGLLRCRHKYSATWSKLVDKYPATYCTGARFVDNGDGTLTDRLTRLIWEKKDASDGVANLSNPHDVDNTYTWSAASTTADGTVFTDLLASLNSSGFAGQHDWRLPALPELQSILSIDALPCETSPCLADPILAPASPNDHLSASSVDLGDDYVWVENFGTAFPSVHVKADSLFVRAVRAGF